jgi:hypothetical protein
MSIPTGNAHIEKAFEEASKKINWQKILVHRNIFSEFQRYEYELKNDLRAHLEYAYYLAKKRDVKGEWAHSTSMNGFHIWCFIGSDDNKPHFVVTYAIEKWDNLEDE